MSIIDRFTTLQQLPSPVYSILGSSETHAREFNIKNRREPSIQRQKTVLSKVTQTCECIVPLYCGKVLPRMEDIVKPWLVVEDEDDIRNIVKVMFQVWGHTAIEFSNGTDAWDWLDKVEAGEHNDDLPELALMDIRMPGHRGHEIARRIRSVNPLRNIPVVLMTAFSLSENERREMLTDYGVDHIISKPLPDMFELKSLLDSIYEQRLG
jgi:CheY-like chemotaxis protein